VFASKEFLPKNVNQRPNIFFLDSKLAHKKQPHRVIKTENKTQPPIHRFAFATPNNTAKARVLTQNKNITRAFFD
jgi:hypothetical protein